MKVLGYSSLGDLLCTLYGNLNTYKMHTIILSALSLSLLLQIEVLEAWIWKPFWTLIFLTTVLLLDFIMAVQSAKRLNGESFKTEKATKFIVSVLAYWITLALAYNLSPLMRAFDIGGTEVWDYFAKAYFFFILFLNLASSLRHMSDLGLLPKKVSAFFIRYIDTHKGKLLSAPKDKETKE